MTTLTRQQFEQKRADKNAVVINVLDEEFYNNAHIAGSINIPEDALDFMERVQEEVSDKGQPIIVYSADKGCPRAGQAARKLQDEGFTDVHDYQGGMEEWKEAGGPLESNIPGALDESDEDDSATGGACGCC